MPPVHSAKRLARHTCCVASCVRQCCGETLGSASFAACFGSGLPGGAAVDGVPSSGDERRRCRSGAFLSPFATLFAVGRRPSQRALAPPIGVSHGQRALFANLSSGRAGFLIHPSTGPASAGVGVEKLYKNNRQSRITPLRPSKSCFQWAESIQHPS